MFPKQELTDLAQRKVLLQAHIALCRLECRAAASELARPVAAVDRGVAIWRKVSPFAKLFALPAGLLLSRTLGRGLFSGRGRFSGGRRGGKFATVISLLPLVLRGAKLYKTARTAFAGTRNAPPATTRP